MALWVHNQQVPKLTFFVGAVEYVFMSIEPYVAMKLFPKKDDDDESGN